MRGTNSYTCVYKHCGIVVDTGLTHAWNASGNTYTGAGGRGAGYANCDLHAYLKSTVLSQINSDLGGGHVYAHQKLLTTGVNTSGYNRYSSASGCSNNWAWSEEYISALTEMQVYGGTIWSSSGYDTGEADQQLEVFRRYKHTDIFEGRYPWLRDISSASSACYAYDYGGAFSNTASYAYYVAALILFH